MLFSYFNQSKDNLVNREDICLVNILVSRILLNFVQIKNGLIKTDEVVYSKQAGIDSHTIFFWIKILFCTSCIAHLITL